MLNVGFILEGSIVMLCALLFMALAITFIPASTEES